MLLLGFHEVALVVVISGLFAVCDTVYFSLKKRAGSCLLESRCGFGFVWLNLLGVCGCLPVTVFVLVGCGFLLFLSFFHLLFYCKVHFFSRCFYRRWFVVGSIL